MVRARKCSERDGIATKKSAHHLCVPATGFDTYFGYYRYTRFCLMPLAWIAMAATATTARVCRQWRRGLLPPRHQGGLRLQRRPRGPRHRSTPATMRPANGMMPGRMMSVTPVVMRKFLVSHRPGASASRRGVQHVLLVPHLRAESGARSRAYRAVL